MKTKRGKKTTEKVVGTAKTVASAAGDVTVKPTIKSKALPKRGTKATLRVSLTDLAGDVTRMSESTKVVA